MIKKGYGESVPNSTVLGLIGLAAIFLGWEIVGRTQLLGRFFLPISTILGVLTAESNRSRLEYALTTTVTEAVIGYGWGFVFGFGAALLSLFIRKSQEGFMTLGVIINAMPTVALGPLLVVVFPRHLAPIITAGISSYFVCFIATAAGFASTNQTLHEMFSAIGASRWGRFWLLELFSALPHIVDGLRLAAPAAVLGAIVGEWFGAERGIGVLLLSAMHNVQITLLWVAALLAALTSMGSYWLLSAIATKVRLHFE